MSQTFIDPQRSVGDLVREDISRARIFEELRIDYCCGGRVPLAQACERRGLDPSEVARRLSEPQGGAPDFDAERASLTELVDHIEAVHHRYLQEALPRLDQLTAKVARRHGEAHPELADLRACFVELMSELGPHLVKEERILFPMIRRLSATADTRLEGPIRVMLAEHESAGELLAQIRSLAGNFEPPEHACASWRAMLDGLRELESDTHIHIHKENNVLFARIAQLL